MPMYYGTSQNNRMPSYYGPTGDTPNQMPYAYGMTNENPMPMQPSPVSSLPPLYPSMLTPQLNPQAPFTTQNMMQSRFAEGGSVSPQNFSQMGEMLREYGDDEDTILAHINPEEAEQLAYSQGMDINPITGLPQFGARRKLKKYAKKLLHKAAPVVGALVGNALLPGIGAPIGGALANFGRAQIEHKDPMKLMMRGAGIGGLIAGGLPLAGKGLGALGYGNAGQALQQIGGGEFMEGAKGLYGAMAGNPAIEAGGIGGAAPGGILGAAQKANAENVFLGGGKGAALAGSKQPLGIGAGLYPLMKAAGAKGSDKNLLGGFGDLGLKDLLLPIALMGNLARKEKMKRAPGEPSFDEIIAQMGPGALQKMWRPDQSPRHIAPFERERLNVPNQQEALEGQMAAYHPKFFKDVNPHYKEGGYYDGTTSGQGDKIPAALSDGEFVIPADVVSAQGDGNNKAGAQMFYDYIASVRHHKGQKQGLPPRAKSISSYMKSRNSGRR